MQLARLVYISDAVRVFERHEVTALAAEASAANEKKKISGLLVHNAGHFVQVLEGPPIEVVTLFERIKLDRRHKQVEQLMYSNIQKRMFWEWAMGMVDIHRVGEIDRQHYRALAQLHEQLRVVDPTTAVLGMLRAISRKMPGLSVVA